MSKGWKERQSYWQSRHRCGKCGKEDAYTMAGRKRCAECCERERAWRAANKEKVREIRKRHNEKYKQEGRCMSCGAALDGSAVDYCGKCWSHILRHRLNRKDARRGESTKNYPRGENGICYTCNKRPAREGSKLCEECYQKSLAALRKAHAVQDLRDHPWAKQRI